MDRDERVRLANYCFGCGKMNPKGLQLKVAVSEGRARAEYRPCEEHQGFPGFMHGGLIATLLDEVMGWVMYDAGVWAMTGRMELRFRRPVPLDAGLVVEATVTKQRSRALIARGELRSLATDELLVESEALFVRVPPEQQQRLAVIYQPDSRLPADGARG